jgi:hypothetical protein
MKLKNLFFNLFAALLIGMVVLATYNNPFAAVVTSAAIFGAGLLLTSFGVNYALMGLQRQVWSDHIEKEIFKDNTFLSKVKKVSADNILGGRVVHIQQSGGSGNVVKNRKNIPAQTRKREDSDIIYLLNDYTTDPVGIPFTEEKELSPEYRNSVLGEDRDKLVQTVADDALYNFVSSPVYDAYGATVIGSGQILSTSGADGVNNNMLGDANRKKATRTDLQRMRTMYKNQNRWYEGKMHCLLTPQMEEEMFPADDVVTATYMQTVSEKERREGVVYKCQGWNIMTRSSVLAAADDGSIKVPGEAILSTDDATSIFWYEEAMEFAMGSIQPFFKYKDPNHYSDVFSFLVYSGGRARRSDYKGIGLLKQAKTA